MYSKIVGNDHSKFWETFTKDGKNYSAEFKNLFMAMVKNDPNRRVNMKEVMGHKW